MTRLPVATRIRMTVICTAMACAAWLAASTATAGQLYRFQDADGNVLLTNQVDAQRKPMHRDRNWGKTEMAVKASASKNRNAFDDSIRLAAQRYELDFGLIKAVIHTESGFDPQARSGPGAQGLMQLMPATARRYNVSNAWDPAQNINAGAKHLRYLMKRYGDLSLALAAYNAGEGNVDKYGGIPPFAETQDYVERVTGRYTRLYGGALAAN